MGFGQQSQETSLVLHSGSAYLPHLCTRAASFWCTVEVLGLHNTANHMSDAIDEECMALEAILEDRFTRLADNQVRIVVEAEPGENSSEEPPANLYATFTLPADYPDAQPELDLANLNNSRYPASVKDCILFEYHEQASYLTSCKSVQCPLSVCVSFVCSFCFFTGLWS